MRTYGSIDIWRTRLSSIKEFLGTLIHSNLPRVALALILAMLAGAVGIALVEGGMGTFGSLLNDMWWALVTMTTVGYGDMVPQTALGKLIGSGVIILGVVLMSMFTATVSSIFVAAKIREGKGLQQVKYRDHIVICGWCHITRQYLETLFSMIERRAPLVVLVADIPGSVTEDLISNFSSLSLKYVRGDWTQEAILKRAGVPSARTVIILPDEAQGDPVKMDEKTILATLSVKALNPKVKLLAHIMRQDNRVFMQRANADEIIVSDEHTGYLLASHSLAHGVPQVVREMLSVDSQNRLATMNIPAELTGKTFNELAGYFFERGRILLGLAREEDPLDASDVLAADTSALDEFIKRKFEEAGMSAAERARMRVRLNPPRDTIIDKRDSALVIGTGN